MNRISSLFSFVGNWLKNVPKYLILHNPVSPALQDQWDWERKFIDPTTGAESSSTYTLSSSNHLVVPAVGRTRIYAGQDYDVSIRCYNRSGTYLTPSPTSGFVAGQVMITSDDLPSGTSYLRLVLKRHDGAVIPETYTAPTISVTKYVSTNTDLGNDSAISLVPGNGLIFSVDPDVTVPNVRIDTNSAAVSNRFFPGIAYSVTLRGVTGYLTNDRQDLIITAPMCLDDRLTDINMTALRLHLRHWNGYMGSDGFACQGLVAVTDIIRNQNLLLIQLHDTQRRFASTNNISCAGDIGIQFTLS